VNKTKLVHGIVLILLSRIREKETMIDKIRNLASRVTKNTSLSDATQTLYEIHEATRQVLKKLLPLIKHTNESTMISAMDIIVRQETIEILDKDFRKKLMSSINESQHNNFIKSHSLYKELISHIHCFSEDCVSEKQWIADKFFYKKDPIGGGETVIISDAPQYNIANGALRVQKNVENLCKDIRAVNDLLLHLKENQLIRINL
jgi:hypothetical protein